jgi:transcriptional regulator with XRE-family HTH domain
MDQVALGTFIRTRREALQPEDVGLRRGSRRRTAGLRREEVADLSDMSTDYLARLERGSGPQPSEQMIGALARGLRLTVDERDHLLLLAGHRAPARPGSGDHVSPGLMRILDRLTDTPAQVMGSLGETLAQNATAVALLGDESHYTGLARSAVYRWFTDPSTRSIYPTEDHDHHGRVQVSQLRSALARLGPQSAAADLAERLQELSPEFATLWGANEVGLRNSEEKRFLHPEVGELSLYCQVVLDPDQMHTLLVFTATPGTPSADKVRLLNVVGTFSITSR